VARYELSLGAQADIAGIKEFTLGHWGKAQAKQYIEEMRERFRHLAKHPKIGRARDDIRGGMRSLLVGSHILYYETRNESVLIIRVVHKSQDPTKQLRSEP